MYKYGTMILQERFLFLKHAKVFAMVLPKPILPGHIIICPNRFVQYLVELDSEEVKMFGAATKKAVEIVGKIYGPCSYNIYTQEGDARRPSEQLHCHIIPRKPGDVIPGDRIYELINQFDLHFSAQYMADLQRKESEKFLEDEIKKVLATKISL